MHLRTTFFARLLFIGLVCAAATPALYARTSAQSVAALAVSTFDTSDQGWRVVGDAQNGSAVPSFVQAGGNPGGYVSARDDATGGVWYWQAPPAFRGNRSASYGQKLSFDLKQSNTSQPFDADDVILVGAGITLVFDTPSNPGLTWTHYAILLRENAGWKRKTDGKAPTRAEMLAVLGNITKLQIRGEYRDGDDTDGLDNVVLGSTIVRYRVYVPVARR